MDLPLLGDAVVDGVHIIIDGLVHALDPVHHKDLPVELLGLVDAGQGLQLVDEGASLFVGDELGGLDTVHQQLQLRQLEHPAAHVVALGGAHDVHAIVLEQAQVGVQTLTLGGDVMAGQMGDHVLDGHQVFLVAAAQEEVTQVEQF